MAGGYGINETRQQEHELNIALQHAMGVYMWMFAWDEFRQQGILQAAFTRVFMAIVRTACIVFWENLFATMVSAVFFSYAVFGRELFTGWVIVFLLFLGIFFLLPVWYFIVTNLCLEISDMLAESEEEYYRRFNREAEIMDDLLKPLQFLSVIILLLAPFACVFILR